MKIQQTQPRDYKATVKRVSVLLVLAAAISRLHAPIGHGDLLDCIDWFALGGLRWLIPALADVAPACVFEHSILVQYFLPILALVWPLFYCVAGE
jgi:hypothetical protein